MKGIKTVLTSEQKRVKELFECEHTFIYISIEGAETPTKSHRAIVKNYLRRITDNYVVIVKQGKDNNTRTDRTQFYCLVEGAAEQLKEKRVFKAKGGYAIFKSITEKNADEIQTFFMYPRKKSDIIINKNKAKEGDKRLNS